MKHTEHLSWQDLRTPLLVIASWVLFVLFLGLAATTTADSASSLFLTLGFLSLLSPLLYASVRNIRLGPSRRRKELTWPIFAAASVVIALLRLAAQDIVLALTFSLIAGFFVIIGLLRR